MTDDDNLDHQESDSDETKLKYEILKLKAEIKNIEKPFFRTATFYTSLFPVVITLTAALLTYSSGIFNTQDKILELRTLRTQKDLDSLNDRKYTLNKKINFLETSYNKSLVKIDSAKKEVEFEKTNSKVLIAKTKLITQRKIGGYELKLANATLKNGLTMDLLSLYSDLIDINEKIDSRVRKIFRVTGDELDSLYRDLNKKNKSNMYDSARVRQEVESKRRLMIDSLQANIDQALVDIRNRLDKVIVVMNKRYPSLKIDPYNTEYYRGAPSEKALLGIVSSLLEILGEMH